MVPLKIDRKRTWKYVSVFFVYVNGMIVPHCLLYNPLSNFNSIVPISKLTKNSSFQTKLHEPCSTKPHPFPTSPLPSPLFNHLKLSRPTPLLPLKKTTHTFPSPLLPLTLQEGSLVSRISCGKKTPPTSIPQPSTESTRALSQLTSTTVSNLP